MQGQELYQSLKSVWQFLVGETKDYPHRTGKSFATIYRRELTGLLNVGKRLATYIIDEKSIPRSKTRAFEKATHLFLSSRQVPRKPVAWLIKNENLIKFLLETESYPKKEVGSPELFDLGPFRIHNIVGLDKDKYEPILDQIKWATDLMGMSRVPKIKKTLYGDIFLAGNIQRAHTLAWYNPNNDSVSLSIKKTSGTEQLKAIIHEFGHRYFQKEMDTNTHNTWRRWHLRCQSTSNKALPKVVSLTTRKKVLRLLGARRLKRSPAKLKHY